MSLRSFFSRPVSFAGRFTQHLEGFTGRRWLFDAFEDWSGRSGASRVFWLSTGSGFGKTAWAVNLAARNPTLIVATWFCQQGSPRAGKTATPFHRIPKMTSLFLRSPIARASAFFLVTLLALLPGRAQSTAETAEAIQRDLDATKAEFVANLQAAISNPENLQSGQTKIGCEQILSKLDQLVFRIDETIDLLGKREADLAGKTGLGEKEKLELKQVLQSQKKPLEASKRSVSSLQSEIKALVDQKLGAVLETYSSFRDIAGPEKAQEKVEERLNEILAPYLPSQTEVIQKDPANFPQLRESDYKSIITNYYNSIEMQDEAKVPEYFADNVDYYTLGLISRSKVMADIRGDWKRYSNVRFIVSDFEYGATTSKFIVDYSLMQGQRPRSGKLQIIVKFTSDLPPKIKSIKSSVISAR